MAQIIEKSVRLDYPLGHHQHLLIAQIPNRLARGPRGWRVADPDAQWRTIRSVLDVVAEGRGNLKKCHFVLFPEAVLPVERVEELLETIRDGFPRSTVTMIGVEHVRLREYREWLARFRAD